MSIGMILLLALSALVLFGVGQRVLDRLRLNDKQALMVMAAIFIGGWLPSIPLWSGVSVNIGGALIPLGLCVYLLIRADTAWERWRAVIGAVVSAGAVVLIGMFFPNEPETMPFDVNYLYGIVAGVLAYILGRSRISSFIAGVLGILLADIAQAVINAARGAAVHLYLGGAGAFDAVLLSGLIAVLLAEAVGTLLSRIAGNKKEAVIKDGRMTLEEEDRTEPTTREYQGTGVNEKEQPVDMDIKTLEPKPRENKRQGERAGKEKT